MGAAQAGLQEIIYKGAAPTTVQGFNGLLDTGASSTCLSKSVISDIGLTSIGKKESHTAAGTISADQYLADIILRYGDQNIVFASMQVSEFAVPENYPFQALIGMDIISKGVLTVSFDGRFTFSH